MEFAYTSIKDYSSYKPESFEFVNGWVRNWFSNFAPCEITIDGVTYKSVESYYQAQKSEDLAIHRRIATLTPPQAKQAGKLLKLRENWEEIKYTIMKIGLVAKFTQEPHKSQLLATGDEMIIEWNNWGDKIWGVTINDCKGRNMLGMALMEVRNDLKLTKDKER